MSHFNSSDWKAWNAERQSFFEYNSQGFDADVKALKTHIKKLSEVAPKDKAGWPVAHAWLVIDKLEEDLEAAKAWQGLMSEND